MDWIRFNGLERFYGARCIFDGVSGVLRDNLKVGLVGPNGAGKSSLVRMLAAIDPIEGGEIIHARDARLGYVGQAASASQKATLREILAAGFARMHAEEARIRELELELEHAAAAADPEREARAFREYIEAHESFDRHGGEGLEKKMRAMLVAFGFDDADLDKDASAFSGGQRTRVALARMLIDEPDYCILDEPTNHLDLETVRWLEEFLIDDPRAMLVVSHDRYFLDRVVDEIWELDGGKLERFDVGRGNAYSAYMAEKAARAELAQREYESFLAEKKRQRAVIDELRTHGSHNYSHVRSREKQFAKGEEVAAPKTSQQKISIKLDAARRATNGLAFSVRALTKAYEKPLFSNLSFELVRGQRLAIVGPNGAGKSTLLNILTGSGAPDHGHVTIMDGVKTASFSQDAADQLPKNLTAVEAVIEGTNVLAQDARALLGRLGLTGDDGDKPVEAFSGGERRRIMLARLMARSADCLFLDEPTNDLDIPSQEALEEVLQNYQGAIVVVSHDRYLLRRLAQRVVWIRDGKASVIDDGYEAFEELQRLDAVAALDPMPAKPLKPAKADKIVVAAKAAEPLKNSTGKNEREQKQHAAKEAKEIARFEREIAKLDAERSRLHVEFADPAMYDNHTQSAILKKQLEKIESELEAAYAAWENLLAAKSA